MIPITRPWMGEAEAQAASRVVLSGWTTQGPEVAAFEREFAQAVQAPYACAVSNCTTALHLALRAAGVDIGHEVITVSHSFIATANSIRYCGAIPVFVDIEPSTFNIDVDQVESAITSATRAILCVHQMGMPCDLARLALLARKYSLPLIEDAACALGSEIQWNGLWERIGKPHGDVACFSFHPRKVVSTGDGGMLTTSHADWDCKFRLWRQHGMSVPASVRHASSQVIFESYAEIGYNYRLTDIQAAVGREQLKRLDEIVFQRRRLAEIYSSELRHVPGISLPVEPPWAKSNWQSYCISLDHGESQFPTMQALLDAGVTTRRGIMCAHRELAYGSQPWRKANSLQQSETAQDTNILLPLYPQMTEADQQIVISTLQSVLKKRRAA